MITESPHKAGSEDKPNDMSHGALCKNNRIFLALCLSPLIISSHAEEAPPNSQTSTARDEGVEHYERLSSIEFVSHVERNGDTFFSPLCGQLSGKSFVFTG